MTPAMSPDVTLTFVSATYSNPEHTAASVETEEASWVSLSAADTPTQWADLHAWGTPSAYVAPASVPRVVTPFQFKTALAQLGIISESEVASPNLPAVAEAAISALPLEDRIKARSRWANMTSAPEDDALLVAMCLAADSPLETIGQVFDLAETIT